MTPPLDRYRNRISLTLYVDNHFIDSDLASVVQFRQQWDTGWISLHRADVLDVELMRCDDPIKQQMLKDLSAAYPESAGPAVFDQSLFDVGLFADDHDSARLQQVFRILFPGVPDMATARLVEAADRITEMRALHAREPDRGPLPLFPPIATYGSVKLTADLGC